MIARLRGTVAAIGEDDAVIDVGGVGYLVHLAPATLQRLPGLGEPVELFTELQVREDDMSLFGFLDATDRTWFRLLQTVQGVGARVALSLLGGALLLLRDDAKAQAAYRTFVGLSPKHARSAELQAWASAPVKAPRPRVPAAGG